MNRLTRAIGGLFSGMSAIEIELVSLREQLQNIDDLHAMCQSAGWIKLRHAMVGRVAMIESEIVGLCDKPEQNAKEITAKRALRDAMIGLLSEVETTRSYDTEIRKRIAQLSEITRLKGLQDEDNQS